MNTKLSGRYWFGYIPAVEDLNDYISIRAEDEVEAAEMVAEMYCEGRLPDDLPSALEVCILHPMDEIDPIDQSPWKTYVVQIEPTIVFHATLKRNMEDSHV